MLKSLQQKYLRLPLWLWILLGIGSASGLLYVALNQPQHAGWRYGACKAFLETYVRFPQTVRIIVGGETPSMASLGFSDINAYGAEQVKMFECHYSMGSSGRPVLSKITLDRRPLPEEDIRKYNAMLQILLTPEIVKTLDTELPGDFPRSLEDFRQ